MTKEKKMALDTQICLLKHGEAYFIKQKADVVKAKKFIKKHLK